MDKKLDATIIKYLLVIFCLLLIYNYSSTIVVLMGFMLNVLRPLIIGGVNCLFVEYYCRALGTFVVT